MPSPNIIHIYLQSESTTNTGSWNLSFFSTWWMNQLWKGRTIRVLLQECNSKCTCVAPDRSQLVTLIAATFRMRMERGTMGVGVAAERWHKGPTHSKVKRQCHRTGTLASYCAIVRKCSDYSRKLLLHFLKVCFPTHFRSTSGISNTT